MFNWFVAPDFKGLRHTLYLVFALLLLAVAPAADAQSAPNHDGDREWTVLIFMNGKNNLEPFAIQNFEQLAKIGSTNKVSFVVQLGRPLIRGDEQAGLKNIYDGWSGARRYLVTRHQTPATGQEVEIVGGGEVDMGAPETLLQFLKWGKERYPAKRYAVVIWNHGQGYRLMATKLSTQIMTKGNFADQKQRQDKPSHRAISQDSDTGSIIYNVDLHESLVSVFAGELRLVGFDACLMAMLETVYELKDVSPLVVGSEELEPGPGWNYTRWATAITTSPTSNESALAAMIVGSYRDEYDDSDDTTLSTVRTDKVTAAATELSKLSALILADRQALFPLVKSARSKRSAYNTPTNPVSIDLIGFLSALESELETHNPSSPALAQTRITLAAARATIVEAYSSTRRAEPFGSYGLAIYFPASKREFKRDSFSDGYLRGNPHKPIAFVDKEKWSEFLAAYLGI